MGHNRVDSPAFDPVFSLVKVGGSVGQVGPPNRGFVPHPLIPTSLLLVHWRGDEATLTVAESTNARRPLFQGLPAGSPEAAPVCSVATLPGTGPIRPVSSSNGRTDGPPLHQPQETTTDDDHHRVRAPDVQPRSTRRSQELRRDDPKRWSQFLAQHPELSDLAVDSAAQGRGGSPERTADHGRPQPPDDGRELQADLTA